MRYDITFIGAGNVAWHLARAFYNSGHRIVQVFSRSIVSASKLANEVAAKAITDYDQIEPSTHIYVYALKDDVLKSVAEQITVNTGIHVHTSGSMPMDVFKSTKKNYGCIYPLQTFSKHKNIDVSEIPFFIEGNTTDIENVIYGMANSISDRIYRLNSEGRKNLHLAGVFACNFTNLMYRKAEQLLAEKKIPFNVMENLITETVSKAMCIGPSNSQTGPAARGDKHIMEQHIAMLTSEPQWQKVYSLLSELIQNS